jgi:hypothetical protein
MRDTCPGRPHTSNNSFLFFLWLKLSLSYRLLSPHFDELFWRLLVNPTEHGEIEVRRRPRRLSARQHPWRSSRAALSRARTAATTELARRPRRSSRRRPWRLRCWRRARRSSWRRAWRLSSRQRPRRLSLQPRQVDSRLSFSEAKSWCARRLDAGRGIAAGPG